MIIYKYRKTLLQLFIILIGNEEFMVCIKFCTFVIYR